jgi:hypothetical protein
MNNYNSETWVRIPSKLGGKLLELSNPSVSSSGLRYRAFKSQMEKA